MPATATETPVPPTETEDPATATASATVPAPTATSTPELPTATVTTDPIVGPAVDEITPVPSETAAVETPTPVVDAPTATATTAATDTPTLPAETATAVPTETPTLAPTDTPSPTQEPTRAPTEEPTATETAPPTEEPTQGPTETPAEEPTEEPTATEAPEPTATPGFPTQSRTVAEDGDPRPVFATGAFRYTVETALRASEVPELELPIVAGAEWVVLVVHVRNWGDTVAPLNMSDLQLVVTGPSFGSQFVALDPATAELAAFLGFEPVLGATDVTAIDPRDGGRLALLYSVPADTDGIELIDGASGLDVAPALAQPNTVTDLGASPKTPELLRGNVVSVVDGQTIVVEVDGFEETVRYLGVTAPTGEACYAAEAVAANAALVEGAVVYLEREGRNRWADGALARDVWIDNGAGGLVLVAALLAYDGAVAAERIPPDTRYAAWIGANGENAEVSGNGLWGVCGAAPTPDPSLLRLPNITPMIRPE